MTKLKKKIHKQTVKDNDQKVVKAKPMVAVKRKADSAAKNGNAKVAKKSGVDYYRPPTTDELQKLKETQSQFHSNFFRMQVEEYLHVVHKKQSKLRPLIEQWLQRLNKEFIRKLKKKVGLQDPLEEIPKVCPKLEKSEIKGKFDLIAPTRDAVIIGSVALNTFGCNNSDTVNVDLAIEMPKEYFQTADYLNQLYFLKKSLYLRFIMKSLAKVASTFSITDTKMGYLDNNPLKPIGSMTLRLDEWQHDIQVRIHAIMEEGTYKLTRFIPKRNNIRAATFFPKVKQNEEVEDLNIAPTPYYNESILQDLIICKNQKLAAETIGGVANICDAIILLKVWLKQRHLQQIFTSYQLTMFMCFLAKSKRIHGNTMTCYQIVRLFFSHFKLQGMEELTKAITLSDGSTDNCPAFNELAEYYETIFMDVTGFYNIFSQMHLNHLKRIKSEAEKSLLLLDSQTTNAFHSLFVVPVPISVQFDHIFHLSINPKQQRMFLRKVCAKEDILNYCENFEVIFVKHAEKVLTKGLGNRIKCIQCMPKDDIHMWDIDDRAPNISKRTIVISFGLILNPDEAFDVVVKGPQANEEELANEFRGFWGEMAQLRRFKDGSITEACIFGSANDPPTKKRLICKNIIQHLISHHFAALFENDADSLDHSLKYFANQLNGEIDITRNTKRDNFPEGYDLETQSRMVIQEFNELDQWLRFMDNLPLEITSISGMSPIFYYAEPVDNFANGYLTETEGKPIIYGKQVYDVVLQLSISGKWPNDLEAIKRLKAAFFLEIGKNLRQQKKCFVKVNPNSIEILKSGFVFRCRLAHHKELQMMKQSIINGMICLRETDESAQTEKELFIKPGLASALHGVHQQHNGYGPTVCLTKNWLRSQLIDEYLWPDECTELLVASLFLDGALLTEDMPVQPQLGFMRFLHLLVYKNWQTEPLILNFNGTLTADEVLEIESKFTTNRNQFPPLTIVTSFDNNKFTGIWTKEAPIIQVLVRAIILAKRLLQKMDDCARLGEMFSREDIFTTSYADYDAVINLNVAAAKFIIDENEEAAKRWPAGFNPIAEYLTELRTAYGDLAAFFCNTYKSSVIGVIWKPNVKIPRDFRITDANGRYLVNDQLTFDEDAVLRDFAIIGTGVATTITKK